jgi:hypothetical protein
VTRPTGDCSTPEIPAVFAGDAIPRPASGSTLRFDFVYQGSAMGMRTVRGVDMTLSPSDGPFKAGYNSGYWADVVDATGAVIFTRLLQDPTVLEAPGPNSDFTNTTVDRCAAKTILLDTPNAGAASEIVFYGSPYGTQDAAVELARFSLK